MPSLPPSHQGDSNHPACRKNRQNPPLCRLSDRILNNRETIMNTLKLISLRKIAKASRSERLSAIIRRFADGRLDLIALENELSALYNRQGEDRSSTLNSGLSTGSDPLYRQILSLITSTFPKRDGLRDDQIESYTNTVSARANTTERLSEYASRGTSMVQVVAYFDENTTDICRMMHGRIFEIANSQLSTLNSQLVMPASFWKDNDHFSQTPTSELLPHLPPYHYNCRTRLVPYIEQSDPFDAAMDRYNNLIKLQNQHIEAIVANALRYEFESRQKLHEHVKDHSQELGISSPTEYLNLVSDLLRNPLKQMGLAISARDRSLNLYVWDPRVRMLNGKPMHDFAVFSLDKKRLKTLHSKPMDKIMQNLDPKQHGKVMLLTDQFVSKGDNMVVEYEVKCYELLPKYFDMDDTTDEQELFNRLAMEKEWDTIPEALKQRILAVDKIVLERYADWFDYNVFNDYIKCIKQRQELENVEAVAVPPACNLQS